ncbi:MAG: MaoC family dehydratase [Pseudomonadota bacterium]|nr:MaoC family dehydratase [Pseudomonadota bacterium]
MSDVIEDLKATAVFRPRGRVFDEFEVGEDRVHHWGRTITEADAIQFAHSTLAYNPLYFNREYAKAHGHPDIVVCPQLVFNVILGLSVEDNSETLGGPFLGVSKLTYFQPVYPGDTLVASSVTLDKRLSSSNQDRGVVTWKTTGINQHGDTVIAFTRSNLAVFSAAKRMREG